MNRNVIFTNKPVGKTPLETLEAFRFSHKKYADAKLSYAGRLDPMAEGLLILLADEEIENKAAWLALDKTYVADVLFGIGTDTGDVLGIAGKPAPARVSEARLRKEIENLAGPIALPLPAYSSFRVGGKALFAHARNGTIGGIDIPVRKTEIRSAKLKKIFTAEKEKLARDCVKKVRLANGDFRQDAIAARWNEIAAASRAKAFPVARVEISCTSGTYVRSVAEELGRRLGAPAMLVRLKRTRVGPYRL